MTLECAKEIHDRLERLAASGGPYAAIFDLSAVKGTTIQVEMVRGLARSKAPVPMGRPHVIVGEAPVIYGLARLFQMCGEAVSSEHEVVHTLKKPTRSLRRPRKISRSDYEGSISDKRSNRPLQHWIVEQGHRK